MGRVSFLRMRPPFSLGSPMVSNDAVPIWLVTPENWQRISDRIGRTASQFARASGFAPKSGQWRLLPTSEGDLAGVMFAEDPEDPFSVGKLATSLPPGNYRFAEPTRQ